MYFSSILLILLAPLVVVDAFSGARMMGIKRFDAKSGMVSLPRSSEFRLYSTPQQKPFKNFDDMLSKLECPVLVDFYAQWCGPCKMMQPVLEDIAGRMEDKIKVAKVDTDRSPRLGAKYQVEALPTLILFNKGEVIERYIGYMTADELEYAVQTTLNRLAQAPPM